MARADVEALIPSRPSLSGLRTAAAGCTGCDLYKNATQTVFGDGLKKAELILVGEQPGDKEDLAGEPFVGPAGRLLDEALEEAGIDRSLTYVTNVVKHFKWEARGKRRIHKKPNLAEIDACRPWLESEIKVVSPRALMALGATAAQALYGRDFKVTKERGRIFESPFALISSATVHPSSILRGPPDERAAQLKGLVEDLAVVAQALEG
ncbi:MAG: UdgX family uracil-DNA binding protein [Actinobacteria bacterium]|nr:UdgX family uracil-DNA binding protein [Actinomycetota bacterium]